MGAAACLGARARPLSRPNPAVGCVIVRDGIVIARGWTQPGGRPHAEAHALAQLAPGGAAGATVYVTLEPCAHRSERGPACADVLAEVSPARVVIGMGDPDPRTSGKGITRLADAGIEVTVLDDAEARESLAGFLVREEHGRPHVTLKLAMSLDGCIARKDGESRWITSEIARGHVHARRAMHDAILVGGGTWRADAPRLDVRLPGLEERSPERIVMTRGPAPDGVRAIASPKEIHELSDVQYLYVEGGSQAASAFIEADLVDRIEIYRAPILIGDGLRALDDIGLDRLDHAHGRWRMVEQRQLGSDHFAAYQRV
ncbi:bifunctional diaminohydroxyphosphoribosylaminopyrimidine deaminase/5-amino-6-(5-phosphoribosylamino)uracil reductase RibD [Altererythrobacter litoralis]|uniref:Riboflavin biosynthesis protein RibD n=1 Tax=Altererythrobacter litoralis TaxID=3113904 RepID=A0ABU7GCG9_9SPHN|nr:bifunctional diaminohydroxyphosphoribosylaminopyrimidine deaminase/5-amino-6-(5-phosphoribosylamino)uracil reductase RibD [Erythrobacteraceae bacterium 1XM1-14]